jgi:hypothetical protein
MCPLAAGSDIRLTRGTTDVFVISLKQSKMLVTSVGKLEDFCARMRQVSADVDLLSLPLNETYYRESPRTAIDHGPWRPGQAVTGPDADTLTENVDALN